MSPILVGGAVAESTSLDHAFLVGDVIKRKGRLLQALAPGVISIDIFGTDAKRVSLNHLGKMKGTLLAGRGV